ncbi:MAG TPA: DUF1926 domain-containing protein [Candidatus Omnitrophica bacterium]|nr:DUF1926 domain-containing protein [Candidatus Omnitrophota bacterium]
MSKLYLLFGVHNHQPVGNFDSVFLKACKECYLPFFEVLSEYPKVKCNIHISGVLWDWLFEKRQEELINLLRKLKEKGQIEFLSGGYYEPIFSIIPHRDRINQIKMMNDFLREEFSEEPQGLWLAERVWEPNLPSVIREAGLDFTLVDDAHLKYAGFLAEEISGFFHTEDEANSVYIFPISKKLRYKIPFSPIEETYKLLRDLYGEFKDKVLTIVDDGEKFGLWPYTYDWVYNKGWLKKFFSLLEDNFSWIETLKFSEAKKMFSSQGIIYLPACSYQEMTEWVLEPSAFRVYEEIKNYLAKNSLASVFLRGGFFRNFFRKYPRINYMHKKMLYLSKNINANFKIEKDREVFQHLFKAQCNCAYWHGVFGGFYLPHLRNAVYENLIKSEKYLDDKLRKNLSLEREDLNLDGQEEFLLKNNHFILAINPHEGGRLEELSLKEFDFNLLNTLTRREESYHQKLTTALISDSSQKVSTIHNLLLKKEKDLDKFLIYDSYEKVALIDHLIDKDKNIQESLQDSECFSEYPYQLNFKKSPNRIKLDLVYEREDLKIRKSLTLEKKPRINIFYSLSLNRNILQNKNFAVEFNLFLVSPESCFMEVDSGKRFSLQEEIYKTNCSLLEIVDNFKKFIVRFEFNNLGMYSLPLYSVSSSEAGFEKNFQQVSLFFINDLEKSKDFSVNIGVFKM